MKVTIKLTVSEWTELEGIVHELVNERSRLSNKFLSAMYFGLLNEVWLKLKLKLVSGLMKTNRLNLTYHHAAALAVALNTTVASRSYNVIDIIRIIDQKLT